MAVVGGRVLAGGDEVLKEALVEVIEGRFEEAADVFADDEVGVETEHALGGGVEGLDDAGFVDGDDAVGEGVDELLVGGVVENECGGLRWGEIGLRFGGVGSGLSFGGFGGVGVLGGIG